MKPFKYTLGRSEKSSGKPHLGIARRKIVDGSNNLIGSYSNRRIYTLDNELWGIVQRKSNAGGMHNVLLNGKQIATVDANDNIYRISDHLYLGTVRINRYNVLVPIILCLVLLFGVSSYFSAYILSKIGIPVYNPTYPEIVIKSGEGQTEWQEQEPLQIFGTTRTIAGDAKISPGQTGDFNFILDNADENNVLSRITLQENNEHSIPISYRLKMNNKYIVGDSDNWLTTQEFNNVIGSITLPQQSKALLTLEWKWTSASDAQDVRLSELDAKYKLTIVINSTIIV